jgi:general secretion pathway protein E
LENGGIFFPQKSSIFGNQALEEWLNLAITAMSAFDLRSISSQMSLTDLLATAAQEAGCTQPQLCRQALEEAAARRGSLIEAVLDANVVDEDEFLKSLSVKLKLPFVADGELEAAENLHNRFPAKLALRHRVYPSHLSGADLTLLTYDPFNLDAKQAVGHEVRKRVTWALATRRRILEALHQGYGVGAENFEELLEGRDGDSGHDDMKQETTILDEADEEATVMSRWNAISASAIESMASCLKCQCLRT